MQCRLLTVLPVLEAMINDADGGPMTLQTVAKTYNRRLREHKASGGQPLGLIMGLKALFVKAGYLNIEATGHPTPEQVRLFWTEERFEDYVLDNPEPRTLRGIIWKGMVIWFHAHFW